MRIERIWAGNDGRNYHYLIGCTQTGEALAVDPLNAAAVLERARQLGWDITQVLNTHEHRDHTGGNAEVVAATGAKVLAHAGAAARIGGVTRGLSGGDVIRVGQSVELRCLDTPGHTRAHLCLYGEGDGGSPALFSGDTLFNAGAGNCLHGGDPQLLFASFRDPLSRLPLATRVFPGHDYLVRNLGFTLDREPSNQAARELASRCATLSGEAMPTLTLAEERQVNVFFRLESPEIIAGLTRAGALAAAHPTAREVFLALRELRNRW
ncbi:MAG TPA: hydroxyacylglutathione hydrolase C-terminal domain-containing protein [Steroidobacteraceae bacterium]|nr:hydroxyacylglutathione hydrolase C-terminal domain-containing protein [Steroidobacteraceae bacterium]